MVCAKIRNRLKLIETGARGVKPCGGEQAAYVDDAQDPFFSILFINEGAARKLQLSGGLAAAKAKTDSSHSLRSLV